jgi:hypothetical protein
MALDLRTVTVLTELVNRFAYLVDFRAGTGVADLFIEDGQFAFDSATTSGRTAISDTYARRAAAGTRTARHLFTNLLLEQVSADTVTATSLMLIFADDGVPPLPITPLLCADVDDEFRLVNGVWYFARRSYRTVFADPARRPVLPIASPGGGAS